MSDVAATRKNRAPIPMDRIVPWILRTWARRPRIATGELLAEMLVRFDISDATAERALRSAKLVLADRAGDPALADRVVEAYWSLWHKAADLHELALSQSPPDLAGARRAIDSQRHTLTALAKHLGLHAPERIEVTSNVSVPSERFDDLSDEQLAALALLDVANAQESTAS